MFIKILLFILGYILGYLTLLIMLKYKEITEKQEKLETENIYLKREMENIKQNE